MNATRVALGLVGLLCSGGMGPLEARVAAAIPHPTAPHATAPWTTPDGATLPELPEGPLVRRADTALEYLSDFFVFVGREAEPPEDRSARHLLFAFDANRGRDAKTFAAEHFAVLWLEGRGWVELKVTGDVPGAEDQLQPVVGAKLPSTDRTRVAGSAVAGLSVEVPASRLALRAESVAFHTDRRRDSDAFATASASGALEFEGTAYRGVVHYELCYLAGINPLARTYTDLFGDGFHGVYGLVDGERPLRLHRSGGRLEPLVARRSGYGPAPVRDPGDAAPRTTALPNFSFDTSKKRLAGFFRWPGRYDSAWTWPGAPSPTSLRVDLSDRETLINYVFGGVAIAVAKGELREGEGRKPVFGFALIVL